MSQSKGNKRSLRARLLEGNRGLTGYGNLWRQFAISDSRVRAEVEDYWQNSTGRDPNGHLTTDILRLDTETFYTVAHDLLKLAALFVDKPSTFKKEPAYTTICKIRSHLIRHAYDTKMDGDTFGGFGISSVAGPELKAGSGNTKTRDQGYLRNYEALMELLQRYEVTFDQLARRWPDLKPCEA